MRRRRRESLTILGRQQLGKQSGVALIEASGRRLVIGYGEQGVTLLHDAGEAPAVDEDADASTAHEADLDGELMSLTSSDAPVVSSVSRAAMAAPAPIRSTSARMADARRPRSPLEGSILAPDTWRKAVVAAQERTTRRS
ncbi:MAG: flagellar biosynthetic protein FliO [Demequinaceae bacterium]|nr:flagellar biosynthetic protein FliO [Demequinaceae bacterium]